VIIEFRIFIVINMRDKRNQQASHYVLCALCIPYLTILMLALTTSHYALCALCIPYLTILMLALTTSH